MKTPFIPMPDSRLSGIVNNAITTETAKRRFTKINSNLPNYVTEASAKGTSTAVAPLQKPRSLLERRRSKMAGRPPSKLSLENNQNKKCRNLPKPPTGFQGAAQGILLAERKEDLAQTLQATADQQGKMQELLSKIVTVSKSLTIAVGALAAGPSASRVSSSSTSVQIASPDGPSATSQIQADLMDAFLRDDVEVPRWQHAAQKLRREDINLEILLVDVQRDDLRAAGLSVGQCAKIWYVSVWI